MSKSLSEVFTIRDEFPAASYDQWRAVVDKSLQGAPFERKLVTHTYEGIDIQPVYCSRDELDGDDPFGFPGCSPFVRGCNALGAVESGWDLRQEYAHPDLALSNREILEDLETGTTSVLLRLDSAAREGFDPDEEQAIDLAGHDGIMAYRTDDLDELLAGVHLQLVGVALDAGAAFLPASAALIALWNRRGVAPEECRGALNADPLATLAREGQLHVKTTAALASLADLAQMMSRDYPHVTAVGVDTSPYHNAGATAVQDIAFAIATSVEYLRAMTAAGLDVDSAARQILFRFGLGTHHFLAISKLRAARRLWSRVIEACGGASEAGAMRIHTRVSPRVLTRRDPHVNLLRNTAAIFAAGLGGASVITSVPFDAMIGLPDTFSRRVARNTALVLQEESHLNRMIDPAGGSWFLDQLTEQLAGKAWEEFQRVEQQGGMLAALANGWISQQIDAAYAVRAKDIARRKVGITGVSEFPNLSEQTTTHAPPDLVALRQSAATRISHARRPDDSWSSIVPTSNQTVAMIQLAEAGVTLGQMSRVLGFRAETSETITPLPLRSFAAEFEELRDASDNWHAIHGRRPKVFLANMGPVAHHTARATYSKNFFEAGGFEVVNNDGFTDAAAAAKAFNESGARIAVICSSDKLYPEIVPAVAGELKQHGARTVVLAGNPGDNEQTWRAAGVDRFIFIRCDVLATLREMLSEEGVLEGKLTQ